MCRAVSNAAARHLCLRGDARRGSLRGVDGPGVAGVSGTGPGLGVNLGTAPCVDRRLTTTYFAASMPTVAYLCRRVALGARAARAASCRSTLVPCVARR